MPFKTTCGLDSTRHVVPPHRRIMTFSGSRILSALCLAGLVGIAATAWCAETKNPCDVITKTEAEAVVGTKLEGPQLSPRGTLCKFLEPGYGQAPSKNKLVTIGLFYFESPDPEAVNKRRQFVIQDRSLLPVISKELPNFGDAAIWVWAGGYFGALYTFKGGKVEVAVKISGISEEAALTAAKKFAARALGGAGHSGYVYAPPGTPITAANYNAPGILSPLYLGTFSQIADDEITRNYIVSLVQAFNGSCEKVPEIFAVMDYGFYYERKANKGTLNAGARNDLGKAFQQAGEALHRAQPHMLLIGTKDASTFLRLHKNPDTCFTPPVEHLYKNIAELALERRNLPPDVADYKHFWLTLSPAAQEEYKNGFAGQPSREEEEQLQKVKAGCLGFTKGAAVSTEGFCRCQVDAARESKLATSDLDLLARQFTQQTLTELARRYPVYDGRKKACYQ